MTSEYTDPYNPKNHSSPRSNFLVNAPQTGFVLSHRNGRTYIARHGDRSRKKTTRPFDLMGANSVVC